MDFETIATRAVERLPVPDGVARRGIAHMVARARRRLGDDRCPDRDAAFAAAMATRPIAEFTDQANLQHYALPAAFFTQVLGPHLKYSSCFYERGGETLLEAEERALTLTEEHADIADDQRILELGCGWGSLSFWLATRFPKAEITAVSNSPSQRKFIEEAAAARGVRNLRIVTADINGFEPDGRFDRIVSVEMFEHAANWKKLFQRLHRWVAPDGKLFFHVFSHVSVPYRFDHEDPANWIAQHFFTGGIMPSHGLVRAFDDVFEVEQEWRWSGIHYARTAEAWLDNFDCNRAAIMDVLRPVYGDDAVLWARRWRLFFLSVAGLFADDQGATWGVSHYRCQPV